MMHKEHTLTMPKAWPHLAAFGLQLHEMTAKLGHMFQIPTGYQDETGFHYGAEPVKRAVQSPVNH